MSKETYEVLFENKRDSIVVFQFRFGAKGRVQLGPAGSGWDTFHRVLTNPMDVWAPFERVVFLKTQEQPKLIPRQGFSFPEPGEDEWPVKFYYEEGSPSESFSDPTLISPIELIQGVPRTVYLPTNSPFADFERIEKKREKVLVDDPAFPGTKKWVDRYKWVKHKRNQKELKKLKERRRELAMREAEEKDERLREGEGESAK